MEYYLLNDEKICFAIQNVPPDNIEHIVLEEFSPQLIGKKYENGEWLEVKQKPQETQLDRIESAVNDIAKNNTSYAEMAQAIAEGVNDIE